MPQIARLPCAASILLVAACQGAETGKPTPPVMTLTEVRFRAYRDADLSMRGQAAEVVYLRQTSEVRARDAVVILPQPGAAELRIAAPVVEGDLSARSYRASGGLVATRGGDEARTASARWSAGDGLVRGDEPVELRGPSYRLAGPSFTLDPATGDLDVRGGVRVVVTPSPGAGR
jgi:hypothetical protein